jgi:hypothetical protein
MSINLNDYNQKFKIDLGNEINNTTLFYLGLITQNNDKYCPLTQEQSDANNNICIVGVQKGIAISFNIPHMYPGYELTDYVFKNKEKLACRDLDDFLRYLTKSDCEKYVQICKDHYNRCVDILKKIVINYAKNITAHSSDIDNLLKFEEFQDKNSGGKPFILKQLINLISYLILNKYDYSIIPKIINKINEYTYIFQGSVISAFKIYRILLDIKFDERLRALELKNELLEAKNNIC